jgi:hypothetical protein
MGESEGIRSDEWQLDACLEFLYFLLQHFLHFALGHVDHGDLHVDFGGYLGDLQTVDRRELECLPSPRSHAKSHLDFCSLEELVIEGCLESLDKVFARFNGLQQLPKMLVGDGPRTTLAVNEISPGMMGNRLQPSAEAAFGIVFEITQFSRELQENLLGYVLGVGILQSPLPAPAIDVSAVMLDELIPCDLIRRVAAKPQEQSRRRCRKPRIHRGYSVWPVAQEFSAIIAARIGPRKHHKVADCPAL